jgi:hypothetical protein
MIREFEAKNPLEEKLLSLYRNDIKLPDFLRILLDSQIVILLDKDVDLSDPAPDIDPLIITSLQGFTVAATFTSIDRISPFVAQFPDYCYALVVDALWFLQGTPDTIGFALNPGWQYGMEMPADGLQAFLKKFGAK